MQLPELKRKHQVDYNLCIMTKMAEEDNDDKNVWNASAVILDIDSGVLKEMCFFLYFSLALHNNSSQFVKFTLICHINGL